MSSGSVNGAGGVPQPPYSSGGPDGEVKTGHKDGRDIRAKDTTPLLGDEARTGQRDQTRAPLGKRSVSSTTGEPVLKSLPKPSERFESLDSDSSQPPAKVRRDSTGDFVPDSSDESDQSTPSPSSRPTEPSASPGSLQPQVKVEADKLEPLPPLTPKQQENKNKFISALSTAGALIKAHKNAISMVLGGIMIAAAVPLLVFAPPAGAVLLGVGCYVGFLGFGMAMFSMDSGGPEGPQPPPSDEKKKEEDKDKPDDPNDPSKKGAQATPSGAGGHFVKMDNPEPVVTTAVLDPETAFARQQAEQELIARQRHMANLQRHMVNDLNKLVEKAALSSAGSASVTSGQGLTPIEKEFIHVISEYLARADIECTDEMAKQIVEAANLIANTSEEAKGMTDKERAAAFQATLTKLLAQANIPADTLHMLQSGLMTFFEQNQGRLTEAAKDVASSIEALINASRVRQPQTGEIPPVVPSSPVDDVDPLTGAAPTTRKKMTVEEVEIALKTDRSKLMDEMFNGHLMTVLDDALKLEEDRMRTVEKRQQAEIEVFRRKTLSGAIDVLEEEKMGGFDFRVKLLDKIDPAHDSDDYKRVQQVLDRQPWFREKRN